MNPGDNYSFGLFNYVILYNFSNSLIYGQDFA